MIFCLKYELWICCNVFFYGNRFVEIFLWIMGSFMVYFGLFILICYVFNNDEMLC